MPIGLIMSRSENEMAPSNGARLVSANGLDLPLKETRLRAEMGGGIARTVVEQRFENTHDQPLRVTYSLPLPADGAVSGFAFRIGDQRIEGEVQRRADARAAFEEAILQGRSAAILEQERSSVFTQEVGNIPPRSEIVAEITVDQPLLWLDEGAWEWRFPTVVAPRYMGVSGRVADADRITQAVADGDVGARFAVEAVILDAIPEGRRPESPSHAIAVERADQPRFASYRVAAAKSEQGTIVRMDKGARLDRDMVVRWAVSTPNVGANLMVGRPSLRAANGVCGYGLLTIVPPLLAHAGPAVGRDLIVLIDTSGSMGGQPLDQARWVVSALIDTLGERDQIEMIEFSSRARRFKSGPIFADKKGKKEALDWLKRLVAGGSTEMVEGIVAALQGVRPDAQRQVVVVTDGQIGFETQVISAICDKLPRSSRLHMVGVGSAVNRSLTGPAARAGGGVEVVVGLGEDPERAAARLVTATNRPLVVDVEIAGSAVIEAAPRKVPDLFAARPVLVALSLDEKGGDIVVRGRTAAGVWEHRISVPAIRPESGSRAAVTLFGRSAVEDAELALAAGESLELTDRRVERLGLNFQIATRLTSWVAITKQRMVNPEDESRHVQQPQELPHGMSAEGLGLRKDAEMAGFGLEQALFGGPADFSAVSELEEGSLGFEDVATIARGEIPKLAHTRDGVVPKAVMDSVDVKAMLAPTSSSRSAPVAGPAPAQAKPSLANLKSPSASPIPAPILDEVSKEAPAPRKAPNWEYRQSMKLDVSEHDQAVPRSRKTSIAPAAFFLHLVVLAIAYYFTRSWWIALLISWGVTGLFLALRSLFR